MEMEVFIGCLREGTLGTTLVMFLVISHFHHTHTHAHTHAQEETMEAKEFLKEASVMKKVRHPCLVQLLGVCTRELPFFIVTEYMPKGNLLDYLRGPDGKDLEAVTLVYMAQQVAGAMAYLESLNMIHRCVCLSVCLFVFISTALHCVCVCVCLSVCMYKCSVALFKGEQTISVTN